MPRQPRIRLAGGLYHVTSRGNRRQPIFLDDRDRSRFLLELAAVVRRYGWICHAFCLLDNHFHLVVETPQANISEGMHRLNGRYAEYFNRRHGVDGHLFQDRFYSTLIETDFHLLELSRYIVLNPARAGLCSSAAAWPWSSYRATAGIARRPRFLTVSRIRAQFGSDLRRACARYVEFVSEGLLSRAH